MDADQARHYLNAMHTLEPNSLANIFSLIQLEICLQHWQAAKELIDRSRQITGSYGNSLEILGAYYLFKGEHQKAPASFEEAATLEYAPGSDFPEVVINFDILHGMAMVLNNRKEEGDKVLKECLDRLFKIEKFYLNDREVRIAAIYAFQGNKKEAYRWLQQSRWTKTGLYEVEFDLWFSSLKGEKKFQEIIAAAREEKKKTLDEIARLHTAARSEI